MSNANDGRNYEVGYRKPPKRTQFQKGRSGNPKGRPRGTLNVATILDRTVREPVVINENGQRKTITKMQAAVKQLVNQAASGDLAALRQLMAAVSSAEQRLGESQAQSPATSEPDQKVMAGILERLERRVKGD